MRRSSNLTAVKIEAFAAIELTWMRAEIFHFVDPLRYFLFRDMVDTTKIGEADRFDTTQIEDISS